MDPLTQLLVQRQMSQGQPPQQVAPASPPDAQAAPVPSVPPNPTAKIPQKAQRFQNAQQLMDSYRNGWTPNPMLLRAQQTK